MGHSVPVIIGDYDEADRPFLRTLYLASRRANWHWLKGENWQLEDFDRLITGEKVRVAMAGEQRAGFSSCAAVDNFLHSLFVSPSCQGQGIGAALLQDACRQFTATGSLKCMAANQHARHFYRRHGWQEIATGCGEEGDYILMHYPRQP